MVYDEMVMSYYNNYFNKPRNDMSPEEEVDRFLKKYESRASVSQRERYYKRIPISYKDWIDDGGLIPFDQHVEPEPMIEMYIPKHRFQDLVEREKIIRRIEEENYDLKHIVERQQEEARIREKNESVRKAFEKYKMLLDLCRK